MAARPRSRPAVNALHGQRRRPARRADAGAAALGGLPLATYTAVLVANTAMPAWHEARRELPFVFAASAPASAGAAAAVLAPASTRARPPARAGRRGRGAAR